MRFNNIYNSIIVPFMVIFITSVFLSNNTSIANGDNILEATTSHRVEGTKINRVLVLEKFLKKYNSPLAKHASTFVQVADKYSIDYRLLPAISCMESACGQKLIPGSYNAWGWGIYGSKVIKFKNFDEGIETVGKGLFDGYIKHGLDTPAKIAPIYTPPMSGHWLRGVTYFMNQMDDVSVDIIES